MAVSFDNNTATNSTSGTAWTFDHTVSGSDRYLVVVVGANGAQSTGVKYNSVSMSLVHRIQLTFADIRLEIWDLVAPATGTNAVEITPSSGVPHYQVAIASSYNGVDQSTPRGSYVSTTQDNQSNSTISINVTTTTVDMVVDGVMAYNKTLTADGGQTDLGGSNPGGDISAKSSYKTGGASSVTLGWSWSGGQISAQIGFCIKSAVPPVIEMPRGKGVFAIL